MTVYGLVPTGFVAPTFDVLDASIKDALKSAFGASIATHSKSVFGQLASIMAERFAALWEVAEAVNASQDPDAATDAGLDALSALTGTVRRSATKSTVTLTLTGTNATVVAVGSRVATLSTGLEFVTTAVATLSTLTAWVATTAYVVGDRCTRATRCYVCVTAGASAGSGGPTTTAADITDGTAHWRYLGEGAAAADATSESANTGPIAATSGDVTTIVTPVGGWSSVINLLDADPGRDVESDGTLRLRRVVELSLLGSTPADSIRAQILEVAGITSCTVFVNDTDTTDGDGVPPHSVEVLVTGDDAADQDIVDAIFANVAAGIGTYTSTADFGTAVDSQGIGHNINFTRAVERTIWVDVTVGVDYASLPSDWEQQIKDAIVAFGRTFPVGLDVAAIAVGAQAFRVTGVRDITRTGALGGTLISFTSPPTGDTQLSIGTRDQAVFDSSRITVHSYLFST